MLLLFVEKRVSGDVFFAGFLGQLREKMMVFGECVPAF